MSFKDKTFFGGDERIRTTESKANGFTVRPIWPTLEHPQVYINLFISLRPFHGKCSTSRTGFFLELMIGLEPTTY